MTQYNHGNHGWLCPNMEGQRLVLSHISNARGAISHFPRRSLPIYPPPLHTHIHASITPLPLPDTWPLLLSQIHQSNTLRCAHISPMCYEHRRGNIGSNREVVPETWSQKNHCKLAYWHTKTPKFSRLRRGACGGRGGNFSSPAARSGHLPTPRGWGVTRKGGSLVGL